MLKFLQNLVRYPLRLKKLLEKKNGKRPLKIDILLAILIYYVTVSARKLLTGKVGTIILFVHYCKYDKFFASHRSEYKIESKTV